MPSLLDILQKVEAYFLPKSGAYNATRDGMRDPQGNALVIDPWHRGGMIKGTDGLLYQPIGTGGYQRTKGRVSYVSSWQHQTMDGETAIQIPGVALATDGSASYAGYRMLSAYQVSGGALNFMIYEEQAKTHLIYSKSCPSGVVTYLSEILNLKFTGCWICWSGAVGAGDQWVFFQHELSAPNKDVL